MVSLKTLTTPVKIIGIILSVLFSILGFFAHDTYMRVTGSTVYAEAAIKKLEIEKLDKREYEADCQTTHALIARKVDRSEYEARHTELLKRADENNQMVRELYRYQLGKKFTPKKQDD